jgi:GNAT superfamily N-acetyltransferase/predicted kinase
MITMRQVAFDDADARALWADQQTELLERYGEPDLESDIDPDGVIASLVGSTDDGTAIATALVRWSPYGTGAGSAEVKRLFVLAEHRGHGHSRVMMGAIEVAARRAGATRLVLETGTEQPEALALYAAIGYYRTPNFGAYKGEPNSICFARDLPTRVLVLNGTVGAGKSTVASAIRDVLTERGARNAFIDADSLCQAEPANVGDPYNQELLFANLRAVAPHYRAGGFGCVVIPRVVEDEADRAGYEAAFAGPHGPAEVTIVRLTASEEARFARIKEREPEGLWRDWALARTVELEEALDAAEVDDAVVANEGRAPRETAEQVLDLAGW